MSARAYRSGRWRPGTGCIAAPCARRWRRRCRRQARAGVAAGAEAGRLRELIDAWLVADLEAPRKQRHTAKRIWRRLVDEHGAQVAETAVRDYVRWHPFSVAAGPLLTRIPRGRGRAVAARTGIARRTPAQLLQLLMHFALEPAPIDP